MKREFISFTLSFCNCLSCVLTVRIFLLFNLSLNSKYDQLPDGLKAQSVEHCTGIAEAWVLIPFKPEFMFTLSFRNRLSCVLIAKIFLQLNLRPQFKICFIYSVIYAVFIVIPLTLPIDNWALLNCANVIEKTFSRFFAKPTFCTKIKAAYHLHITSDWKFSAQTRNEGQ